MANPYTLQPVTAPAYFDPARGGRGALAGALKQNLCRAGEAPDCVCLLGERRFGKTSLLRHLQQSLAGAPGLRVAGLNLLTLSPPTPEGLYAAVRKALARAGALPAGQPLGGFDDLEDYLYRLAGAGERLVLLVDEFDLVARDRNFPRVFFDQLRGAAGDLPLTLVLASVLPLSQFAHAGVYGSPFFNIFLMERLGPLAPAEAEALVRSPGGQPGLPELAAEALELAGRHPYFLQLACHAAWDLRACAGTVDRGEWRSAFAAKAREQMQYVWDHSGDDERQALCGLARGAQAAGEGLGPLVERGYVAGGSLAVSGAGFAEFVRGRCAALPRPPVAPCPPPAPAGAARPPLPPALATCASAPELRLALVLGVNRYLHQQAGRLVLPELRYAERDADALADFLERELRFTVIRLTGERATCAGLLQAFRWLEGTTAADPHPASRFVFHFSGHGQVGTESEEVAYLMLHDSDPRAPAAAGLDMFRLVYDLLPLVRVPNALVLLDACHAGFAAGVRDMEVRPADHFANVARHPFRDLRGRMVLAACAGEAQAREEASLGHGIFTSYVLKHWRDREGGPASGRITFGSLVDYVGEALRQHGPDVPLPVYNGVGVGGTLVLRST
jgi:hypothetical protein